MYESYVLPPTAIAGSIYFAKSLDTSKDIVVTFDYACYGEQVSGSEGFCVIFANSFPGYMAGGGPGPGLGYTATEEVTAWKNGTPQSFFNGVEYGEIGVGFDITGNYGLSAYGHYSGTELPVPNSITIRDSFNTRYNSIYTSPNLATSAVLTPVSFYQQVISGCPLFYRARVRLTDFGNRIIVDIKHPYHKEFINYVDSPLPNSRPPTLYVGLAFTTGLTATNFKIKNFCVNGIFTTISGDAGTDLFTYIAEPYLGLIPTPAILTINDTLSVVNAPPYDTGPILSTPLITITTGTAPFEADDGYVLITPV